jgi:hypothetical protein
MQTSQVQQSLSRIERCIDDAVLACRDDSLAPTDLRACIADLDRRSDEALQLVNRGASDDNLRDCVDSMERVGDRAMKAARGRDGQIDRQLRDAVQRAHDEISQLKHQLH